MLKSIGFIFLLIFVIAIGYDVVATVAHALESGTLSSWLPATTPLSGLFWAWEWWRNRRTDHHFSIFDKGGDGYKYITQGYGRTPYSYMYIGDWHNGIDIAAIYGAPIYSPAAATVLAVGDQDDFCPRLAFGRFVVIEDNTNHLMLLFAHLADIDVQPGEAITKNQLIGTVGNSGDETGTHLHFSIFEVAGFSMAPAYGCGPYPQGHDVDPLDYLGTVYQ